MKIRNEIRVTQSQKLSLTPALKQSIQILKLSQKELDEFLNEELQNNPALISRSNFRSSSRENSASDIYQNVASSEDIGLVEHLESQLREVQLDSIEEEIAKFIIGNIDSNGYLDLNILEIVNRFNTNINRVEEVISVIHSFEPAGIGARDLREALQLQLKRKKMENSLAYRVVQHALEDLAGNKISTMAKKFKVNFDEILEAKKLIVSLDPRPGSHFSYATKAKYVEPDIIVEKINGEYTVSLSKNNNYNELNLNSYYTSVQKKNYTEEEVEYINKKIETARNIINSIKQRNATILKITTEIVEFQKDFFEKGSLHLKPFSRKTVAESLNIHESTVSRAVKTKILQCDRGLIKLSFFFQSGLKSASGDIVSAESIKQRISSLISKENRTRPLSDNQIVDSLQKEGLEISRRCVTKYRLAINIPSSSKRKKYN